VRGVRSRFDRALKVLRDHRSQLTFPVEHFKWNAAQAIIANDRGLRDQAQKFAATALEFAARDHSGFRYHPDIGLVSDEHAEALRQLRKYSH
jgi:hypothetical protein